MKNFLTGGINQCLQHIGILSFILDASYISISLAMVGKLCISASFGIIYVFSAELFPTVVRNVGVGTASLFARVGGVVAPYIGQLVSIESCPHPNFR